MKRFVLVFGLILVTSILCSSSGLMAQDPADPGEPDTVYFTVGGRHSPDEDTFYICPDLMPEDVVINVNFWNDNYIAALTVPFVDSCNGPPCSADLDPLKNYYDDAPICFEGSRVEHFEVLVLKYTYWPPVFMLAATAQFADPIPPGDGLLGTLVFTVFDTGRICLDTTFVPPSAILSFVDTLAVGYSPVFEKRTFVISKCTYTPGDPNYDGKTDIVDVVYLVNYLFRSGPGPCVQNSGDASCDGEVNVVDVVYLIGYLFKGGPPPGYCP